MSEPKKLYDASALTLTPPEVIAFYEGDGCFLKFLDDGQTVKFSERERFSFLVDARRFGSQIQVVTRCHVGPASYLLFQEYSIEGGGQKLVYEERFYYMTSVRGLCLNKVEITANREVRLLVHPESKIDPRIRQSRGGEYPDLTEYRFHFGDFLSRNGKPYDCETAKPDDWEDKYYAKFDNANVYAVPVVPPGSRRTTPTPTTPTPTRKYRIISSWPDRGSSILEKEKEQKSK